MRKILAHFVLQVIKLPYRPSGEDKDESQLSFVLYNSENSLWLNLKEDSI